MKLLFILLLGLGFSQAELTTRVYSMENVNMGYGYNSPPNSSVVIDLYDLTGYNIDYALLKIIDLSNVSTNASFSRVVFNHPYWASSGVLGNNSLETGSYSQEDDLFVGMQSQSVLVHNNQSLTYFLSHYSTLYDSGYMVADVIFSVTAEFPEEDTGYIEEGFQFCLHSGANLVSFPCDNPVSVETSLPNGIENFVSTIIGEGQATSYTSNGWIGNLDNFTPGSGYWFKSNSDVCFEYECVES